MALLRNTRTKNRSEAYDRLFGVPELGALASKIQSTVISVGNELERIISKSVPKVPDVDEFLKNRIISGGIFLAYKTQIKHSRTLDSLEADPDFMVFKRCNGIQYCYITELKGGHVFDTKKANVERQAIHRFIERNAHNLQYRMSIHFCAFNQHNKETIRSGFKNRVDQQEAMTGREFCDLLEIDYDDIVERRKADRPANVAYFLEKFVKIEPICDMLNEVLAG